MRDAPDGKFPLSPVRFRLTRLSLSTLVLLAGLAVVLATLLSGAPRARAQATPAGPGASGVSLLTPAPEAPGRIVLTAWSAAGRAAYARSVARSMLSHFHWSPRQFWYLNRLWNAESGWNKYAYNPSSGAYGIPQALPGSKMASAGPDWQTSAATQIRWGLGYIKSTYGSPCAAWSHEGATGWY